MLEREIREMAFVPRWSIVRTNRQQYLAEHSYFVAMYANDIAVWLGLGLGEIGILLQIALWHDMEEIFSGDLPGPCKRAAMTDRETWDKKLVGWLLKVFDGYRERCGTYAMRVDQCDPFLAIIKVADYIDECCEMGTELQMGNRTVERIFADSLRRVKKSLEELRKHYPMSQAEWHPLESAVIECCLRSRDGESRSTRIFETL